MYRQNELLGGTLESIFEEDVSINKGRESGNPQVCRELCKAMWMLGMKYTRECKRVEAKREDDERNAKKTEEEKGDSGTGGEK